MISVIHDPAGAFKREIHHHTDDILLLDWVIEKYGVDGFSVPTIVFINNVQIQLEDYVDNGCPITEDDYVVIIHKPQGVDPFTIFIVAAITATVVGLALVPSPEVPEINQPRESPNNNLSGQTNIARPLQRIPDIYGVNKVFPDLIANSYFEFVNHIKVQNEFMCIGRGEYLIEEERTGDTLISQIEGSVSTIYEPFTIPSDLINVQSSNEVNGQEIIGGNIPKLDLDRVAVTYPANNQLESTDSSFSEFELMTSSETFTISNFNSNTIVGAGDVTFNGDKIIAVLAGNTQDFQTGESLKVTGSSSNDGTYKVLESDTGSITCLDFNTGLPVSFVTETSSSPTITNVGPNTGVFTFDSVSSVTVSGVTTYTVTVTETTFTVESIDYFYNIVSAAFRSNEVGPFNVPGEPDQVWVDIEAPRGLKDSGFKTIELNVRLQQIDSLGAPVGSAEDNNFVLNENTSDPRFYTFKFIPLNPGNTYECSIIRKTDNADSTTIFDETKWSRLAGVEDVSATDFGNVTTWFVTTRATEQATSIQDRKFNCIATRKLPTYDPNTDSMTTVTFATAKVADAIVNMITDSFMGNKSESQIDLAGLYAIQDALDSDLIYGDKLGRFCYSFSNERTPVGDELNTALKSCRMFKYQEGSTLKFGRDQKNDIRTTLFNRRVKKPDSESKIVNLFKPDDFDGITIEWVDERTGDGKTINFPEGGTPTNAQKIKAAGVKNYEQAWNLGSIEYNKLLFRRTSVKTTVLRDGLLVFPNARVGNVDSTTLTTQDGEIVGVVGSVIETRDVIDFKGNASASVILRDESGIPSDPLVVTPRTDQINGFVLSIPSPVPIKIRGDHEYQMGTLYNFAPDSNHLANDYLVQSITPGNDGYIELELINYSESLYDPDTTTPTPET